MIKILAHICTITHHKITISGHLHTNRQTLNMCTRIGTAYIPSGACCVFPMTKKRVPMHSIIYGIIVGIAVAAVVIVQLGNVHQPGQRNASHQPNAHDHDYDNLEELS